MKTLFFSHFPLQVTIVAMNIIWVVMIQFDKDPGIRKKSVFMDKILLYLYIWFYKMFLLLDSLPSLRYFLEFCVVLYFTFSNLFLVCRTQSLSWYYSNLIIIALVLLSFSDKGLVFMYLFHSSVLQCRLFPAVHSK